MRISRHNTDYFAFAKLIRESSRYCLLPESRDFLSMLKFTWESRIEVLDKDGSVFRAQNGCEWETVFDNHGNGVDRDPVPFCESRMRPDAKYATAGRSNVAGIPAFYASSDKATAIAEVRPGCGDFVSVATFNIRKGLRLINCTMDDKYSDISEVSAGKITEEMMIKKAWHRLNVAFARPVSLTFDQADYIPTQAIAEFFKLNGFDGFHHRSALGDGHNLVLFDVTRPEFIDAEVHKVKSVKYETTQPR